jgi:tetratricopeptide (TPR) repeat protein
MDLKFKKIMAIVVLSVLAFNCYAEDAPEPNKPAIDKKVDPSSERSEVELITEPVPEGDKSTDQIEAELAREYYKDCVQNLKWALGIIVGLVVVLFGFVSFKGSKEHRETLADAKEALRDARSASDKARDYEEKAHERLSGIDKEVAIKLKEIEEKGKALVTELIQESEKQRETSREEAEKERKASELWNMGLRTLNAKDFESAANYFAAIAEIRQEDHAAYNNWGVALTKLSRTREGPKAEEILVEALEKCEKAVEIKPDYSPAYNNWGTALLDLARRKKGAESYELLRQAFEKYQKSVEIKPDNHEAYNNWGAALSELAKRKEGAESDELFRQAFEKYQKTLSIKSEYFLSFDNWGGGLLYQAQKKSGKEKQRLLDEATQMCLKADSIKKGEGAYNLACVYAILGDEEKCRKWLETGEKTGALDTYENVMKDADLESVRDKEWFKEIRWPGEAK